MSATSRPGPRARETFARGDAVRATDGTHRTGIVVAERFVRPHTVYSVRGADGRTWDIPEWNVRRANAEGTR